MTNKPMSEQRLMKVKKVAEIVGITATALHRYIKKRCPSAKTGTLVDLWHGSDSEGEDTTVPAGETKFCDYLIERGVDPWLPHIPIATERRNPQAMLGVSQSQDSINKLKNKQIMREREYARQAIDELDTSWVEV
ncbi:hypothetical protein [Vibrio sp. M260118]|uniref:hypothetical protein n=1 Tax=Vibrio sp. M260118 TaxID=3020896 RepID=UPI002F3F487C